MTHTKDIKEAIEAIITAAAHHQYQPQLTPLIAEKALRVAYNEGYIEAMNQVLKDIKEEAGE
jgi:hypothetical protein